jgi:hypothetical protein
VKGFFKAQTTDGLQCRRINYNPTAENFAEPTSLSVKMAK